MPGETTFGGVNKEVLPAESGFSSTLFKYDVTKSKNKKLQSQVPQAFVTILDHSSIKNTSKVNESLQKSREAPALPPRGEERSEDSSSDDDDLTRAAPVALLAKGNSRNASNRDMFKSGSGFIHKTHQQPPTQAILETAAHRASPQHYQSKRFQDILEGEAAQGLISELMSESLDSSIQERPNLQMMLMHLQQQNLISSSFNSSLLDKITERK